ncbi:hypothetical protein HU200_013459 [Digitaria exilis]|uniref:Uncharacterized protein n=1 Tax=Digitaria exilis TaxID=1010633 RepID=A0A835KNS9_9POAL|nr:hypothetical protein HU200_013459 [Digitaria exilis]
MGATRCTSTEPEVEGQVLEQQRLTLLLQVSPVPDLQNWRADDATWIPVDPGAGCPSSQRQQRGGDTHQRDMPVVNVRHEEAYKNIEHKAVANTHHEQVSVAAFHSAKFGDTYGLLEEIVGAAGDGEVRLASWPVQVAMRPRILFISVSISHLHNGLVGLWSHPPSVGAEDYVELLLSSKLEGKNIMDAMKINPA